MYLTVLESALTETSVVYILHNFTLVSMPGKGGSLEKPGLFRLWHTVVKVIIICNKRFYCIMLTTRKFMKLQEIFPT